jgi:predicted NUDIX family NTP pyrophosphohydrolase
MVARSAGLLLFRRRRDAVEVLLVHPGGPFWAKRDEGAWSIPKGEYEPGEDPLATAQREFAEEVGFDAPAGALLSLGELRQPGGKRVCVWAVEGDLDPRRATSNTFELEWPRGSGRIRTFPEVDRVEWMAVPAARTKLLQGQRPFLDALSDALTGPSEAPAEVPEGPGGGGRRDPGGP